MRTGKALMNYEQKKELSLQICELYGKTKNTLNSVLASVGINSRSTWLNWCRANPEIAAMYDKARLERDQLYKQSLVERAKTLIEQQMEGQIITLVEEVEDKTKSSKTNVVKTIKRKQIYIRPDVRAAIYALENFDPENFSKNPKIPDNPDAPKINIPIHTWTNADGTLEEE